MPHRGLFASAWLLMGVLWLPAAAGAAPAPAMSDLALPGGLAAARTALGDRTSASAALFLGELIERFYNTPKQTDANQDARFQAFMSYLERAAAATGGPSDPLPLPITPDWWVHTVLAGRSTPSTLLVDILKSRDAALMYRALLTFDDDTRTWFAEHPALVHEVVAGRGALLVLAAPGIRVSGGRVLVPGGDEVRTAWEGIVGASAVNPEAFLRAVITQDAGMVAYFYGRMGRMPARSVAALLATAGDSDHEGLGRLYRVYRRAGAEWRPASRPFAVMPQDPSLLVGELPLDDAGRIAVPGGPAFWERIFDMPGGVSALGRESEDRFGGETTDASWLADQVYRNGVGAARVRTQQVLLACRLLSRRVEARSADVMVTIAALPHYPALVLSLERLGVTDPAVYRGAVLRAVALLGVHDVAAQGRSVAQFQSVLALLIQARRAGAIGAGEASRLVASVSEIPLGAGGDYEGRVAAWVDAHLRPLASRPASAGGVDGDILGWCTTRAGAGTPLGVAWEGTRYRVDTGFADARRIANVRGERPLRALGQAWSVLALAAAPSAPAGATELADLDAIVSSSADDAEYFGAPDLSAVAADARAALRGRRDRAAGALRRFADALLARGLMDLAYAVALGGGDGRVILSGEAASRHDLGIGRFEVDGAPAAWQFPTPAARARGVWHLEGALVGLDLCLADSWLRRRSERPPAAAPTMDRNDRRALAEAVPLMVPATLSDVDRDRIAAALHRGRARLASAAPDEIAAIASVMPLGAVRRGVWGWAVSHGRAYFEPLVWLRDQLALGGDGAAWPDAWGAPSRPRDSGLRLEFPPRPPDDYTGHLSSGILMSAVPDINLRLAEWLAVLHMPASLLPAVLAAATLDVIDGSPTRYTDDLRSIAERVEGITLDDVEQYLALLTTDGPLVPDDEHAATSSGGER